MNNASAQIINNRSNLTTEQITARGNVRTKLTVIIVTGTICLVLTVGGLIAFFTDPATSKDIWVIIGPIISAGISGIISFFAGENHKP